MSSLDRLLSGADPDAGRPPVRADGTEANAVLEAVLADPQTHATVARHRRAIAVGMIGVAAVVLAAVVLIAPGGTGPAGSAAAATLLRLSRVAAAQPSLLPTGPGQYYFSSYEYPEAVTIGGACGAGHCLPTAGTFTVRYRYVEAFWIRPGGLTHIRITRESPTLVAATRAGWIAAGRPSIRGLLPRSFSEILPPTVSGSNPARALLAVRRLPTAPAALETAVDAGPLGGPGFAAQNRFNALAFVLSTGSASPQLRSAALKVLATVPGVQSLGTLRDPLGRRGDAFAVAPGERAACDQAICPASEMIVDPADGLLLAEATLGTGGAATWTTYLSTGIANSISTPPDRSP